MLALVAAVLLSAGPPLTPVSPRLITVVGQSKMTFPANQATAQLTVTAREKDQKAAMKLADEKARKLLDALAKAGAEEHDVLVNPHAANPDYRGNEVIAWDVTRIVTVTMNDLKKVDAILTAALKAGATMHGAVSFTNTNVPAFELKARIAASTSAKEKAVSMVEALGGKLGLPRTVSDASPHAGATALRHVVAGADGSVVTHATEIELFVNGQVNVQFDIRDEV